MVYRYKLISIAIMAKIKIDDFDNIYIYQMGKVASSTLLKNF